MPCWYNNDGILAIIWNAFIQNQTKNKLAFKPIQDVYFSRISVYICWMMHCLNSTKTYILIYIKNNLHKNHQIKLNVWFHSWLCVNIRYTYRIHNMLKLFLDLYCVALLQIFCQNAQIEHLFIYSYGYLRVLFLACDGRRRSRWSDCITDKQHSDHLAFFRRMLGTRLGTKYQPYWNYIWVHVINKYSRRGS